MKQYKIKKNKLTISAMISPEQRRLKLRQMILLRPLLVQHGSVSQAQRNEVIEFLTILRFEPNQINGISINNEDQQSLETIINYANDYMIRPFNFEITSPVYTEVLRKWVDLSVWFNLSNELVHIILDHLSPV